MTDFAGMGKSVSVRGYYNCFARKVPFVRNGLFRGVLGKNLSFVKDCAVYARKIVTAV
jgi:hypothetical protein